MLKSFGFALKGLRNAWDLGRNVKIQFLCFLLMLGMSWALEISTLEFLLLLFISALVLCLEILNTSIEELCNFVKAETDPKIGRIKDLAAGAVLLASLFAATMGMIVFIPKIISFILN
jgi:hypothetical protein